MQAGLVRGGQGGTKYRARHVLRSPALTKFFFRVTREEMLEKLHLRYVKTYVQCAKQGGTSLPSKNSRPPRKEKKFVQGGCQNVPLSDKYREFNVFYKCCLWVRTAAILSSISCSHYGFLRKLIKNNLFNASITEQNCSFFINIATRQQFFISVSESTKNMSKQRFPNFCHIIFEIESMNKENASLYLLGLRPSPRRDSLLLSPKPLASFIKQKPA